MFAKSQASEFSIQSPAMQRAARYHQTIKAAADRYSLDPNLLWTIAYLETGFRPELVSNKGARGMMQFILATGRRYGLVTVSDFHDSVQSINAAARYVRDLCLLFDRRVDLILAAYNAGEKAVISSGYKVPTNHETASYVVRGLSVFKRITRANILAVYETALPQGRSAKHNVYSRPRHSPRIQPAPSQTASTRSIYFAR